MLLKFDIVKIYLSFCMVEILQRTKLPLKAQPQVADVLNYSVFLGGVAGII